MIFRKSDYAIQPAISRRSGWMLMWRKENQGMHRAYDNGHKVAVVQGSKLQGWRYSLAPDDWSDTFATMQAAKKAAEKELAMLSKQPLLL
jgi:uncharacterized protein YcnI